MKIAILTFSKEDNNGANLQCYALVKILKELGHIVDIIDIQLPAVNYGLLNRFLHFPQHYNFLRFRKEFLNCFTKPFHSVPELKANLPVRDLYIVGSDQVWNLDITRRLDPLVYFFSFLPDEARRMAYAASFGVSEWVWGDAWKNEVGRLLSKFEKVSVRETQGVEICRNIFEINAQVACDPTLLLSSYDDICGPFNLLKETNELVYFKFRRNPKVERYLLGQSKKKRLKMVKLGDFRPHAGCLFRPVYTVKGWLNSIRYARFILTDSFHCMVFCILFNKSFIAMPSSDARYSRMTSLLKYLNLSERFCYDVENLKDRFETLYTQSINYVSVNERINMLRHQGLDFLKSIK